jgi:hypothetical protein
MEISQNPRQAPRVEESTRGTRLAAPSRMTPRTLIGSSLVLTFVVACSGSTVQINTNRDSGVPGPDGGQSGDAGPSCSIVTLPGDRACVPGTAPPNRVIEIEAAAGNDCVACGTSFEPCQVKVAANTITVSIKANVCQLPPGTACPASCEVPITKCSVPALPAGSYKVVVDGENPNPGIAPRTLEVSEGASDASCSFPRDKSTTTISGSGYATNCSVESDCEVVTVGDTCQPCTCPNFAIAKSALPRFQSDFRSIRSSCTTPAGGGPVCAGCLSPKVTCDTTAGVTGVCKLVQ